MKQATVSVLPKLNVEGSSPFARFDTRLKQPCFVFCHNTHANSKAPKVKAIADLPPARAGLVRSNFILSSRAPSDAGDSLCVPCNTRNPRRIRGSNETRPGGATVR